MGEPQALFTSLRWKFCRHDWQYDHKESQGPWTGYIECCSKCGAISQVPL